MNFGKEKAYLPFDGCTECLAQERASWFQPSWKKLCNIILFMLRTHTYDHRLKRTRHPVRSAKDKP
jgi:hypothetical protein